MSNSTNSAKLVLRYCAISSLVNISWLIIFLLGTYAAAQTDGFFNTMIRPSFYKISSSMLLLGMAALMAGAYAFNTRKPWAKKISYTGTWILVIHPAFPIIYILLLAAYGKGGIGSMIGALFCVVVAVANFFIAKKLFLSY